MNTTFLFIVIAFCRKTEPLADASFEVRMICFSSMLEFESLTKKSESTCYFLFNRLKEAVASYFIIRGNNGALENYPYSNITSTSNTQKMS